MKSLAPCSRGCGRLTHRGRCRGPPYPGAPRRTAPYDLRPPAPSPAPPSDSALLLEKLRARNGLLNVNLGPVEQGTMALLVIDGKAHAEKVDGYTLWRATEP